MSSSFVAKPPIKVVKGIINVQPILSGELAEIVNLELIRKWIDSITLFSQGKFLLELVAAYLDPSGKEKETVKATASYTGFDKESNMFTYGFEFQVPNNFGEIGALLVKNTQKKDKYIKNIILLDDINVTFTCESWIHCDDSDEHNGRIFFSNKSCLPSKTPAGLKSLREKDLKSLRGNSAGERKPSERIYDYDMYNDLGDPDTKPGLARPVLGGKEHPYPRRCRTGRARTISDPDSESRKKLHFYDQFYVPRDEAFSDRKVATFVAMETLSTIAYALVPSATDFKDEWFSSFKEANQAIELDKTWIEKWLKWLFEKWADLNHVEEVLRVEVPNLFEDIYSTAKTVQRIEDAQSNDEISFSWYRDEEFCRQTLAGINPYSIRLVTEWPLMSKLDPKVYGPAESAITKENVEQEINMTLKEALEKKKLFLLDYHDLLLPYVNRVRKLEGTTLYGSRTLMFLTSIGTLKPVAIELTSPPNKGESQWKRVYMPCSKPANAIETWLWKLAKAHVLAHDSGYHQLVSHWLRTHCVMEPYIIATHRRLSKMHPIHSLLSPHLRYTMRINSLARLLLINAGGIIESNFSLGKYSMQLSSNVYAKQWRFDHEALPSDLINRGMGVEDPSAPYGIKLTIEDYPFANDGLILWDAIKHWATAYVNHYYPQADLVESDKELQSWWTEIRAVGHGDKKDEPWWPKLKTQQDLIGIVSTIMWVASGHHSAVNFGQYYAVYSHRPTITRTKMPDKDLAPQEWDAFVKNPALALENCLPLKSQSSKVMSTLDVLSNHSPDEEYIGVNMEAAWKAHPTINAAFIEFRGRLKDLENTIDSDNKNPKLKNRIGRGSMRYELLKPLSEPGVTGKGVPYSISI